MLNKFYMENSWTFWLNGKNGHVVKYTDFIENPILPPQILFKIKELFPTINMDNIRNIEIILHEN